MVKVVCDFIVTQGLTFHPCPRSLEAPCPIPVVAFPPPPLAPLKFSGLMDLVFASESRKMLFMPASMPLYFGACCASSRPPKKRQVRKRQSSKRVFFILADF